MGSWNDGSSPVGTYWVCLASGGGMAGSDLSMFADFFDDDPFAVFFLLLAIKAS